MTDVPMHPSGYLEIQNRPNCTKRSRMCSIVAQFIKGKGPGKTPKVIATPAVPTAAWTCRVKSTIGGGTSDIGSLHERRRKHKRVVKCCTVVNALLKKIKHQISFHHFATV